MTTDSDDRERLDQLRRVAYGRAHTPEEFAAAAAAREALADAEAKAEARESDALAAEPDPGPDAEPASQPVVDETAEPVGARHRGWVVPAVIALVIGALVGGAGSRIAGATQASSPSVATSAPAPTFTPGSSGLPAPSIPVTSDSSFISGPGNLEAAEGWFRGRQSEDDINTMFVGDEMGVGGQMDVVADSTRLVQSTAANDIWVAKTSGGGLCLIVSSRDGSGGAACGTAEEFAQNGLTLGQETLQLAWDGVRLATSTTAP